MDPIVSLNEEKLQFGMQSLSLCSDYYPEITEEIRGMAEGMRFPYEPFAAFLFNIGLFGDTHGCTCFCFQQGDDIVFARNHDMFTAYKKTTESCLYRPDKGYTFIGQGDALIGKEDGVNEHGLAVGMTFVASQHSKPGLNFLFLVRCLLEKASNVAEAINLLHTLPISTAQNIILADKNGDMAVVECSSLGLAVRKPENGSRCIVASNQFIDPAMTSLDHRPEADWYSTQTRYNNVVQALQDSNSDRQDSLELAKQILSGKCGFMCQYKKELSFDTLWSFVVRLNDLDVWRAEGNPGKSKYKKDTRLSWAMKKAK